MKIELRKLEKSDTSLFYEWWNDEEVCILANGKYTQISDLDVDKKIEDNLCNPLYYDFIILDDENPIGHTLIKKDEHSDFFTLYIAIAKKNYWDKGVGTEVVKKLCDWFWKKFPEENILELGVEKSNARAIRCYEKAGFETVREKHYKDNSDTFTMQIKK